MRPIVSVLFLAVMIYGAQSAQADETFSITGTDNVSGNDGFILEIDEPGYPTIEFFTFVEAGKHRIFAEREKPGTTWELITPAAFLVAETTMSINDSWNFLASEDDELPITATVRAIESVTVDAGTFTAYKVEFGLTSDPSILDAVFWFVDGVGIVRQDFYSVGAVGNPFEDRVELAAYTVVGGSGFFPSAVGNSWSFLNIVATEESSWGSVKSRYDE